MSYMSQLSYIFGAVLFVFGPAVFADPPEVAQWIIECQRRQYQHKMNELTEAARLCNEQYAQATTEMAEGKREAVYPTYTCIQPAVMPEAAEQYAREKCAFGPQQFGPYLPPREELSPTCVSVPGVMECPTEGGGMRQSLSAGADPALPEGDDIPRPRTRPKGLGTDPARESKSEPAERREARTDETPSRTNPEPSTASTARVQEPGAAQYEAQQDIQSCVNAQATASRCCGNPQSCTGTLSSSERQRFSQLMGAANQAPPEGMGLQEYCTQMRSATSSSSQLNNMMSSICYSQKTTCTSTCQSLAAKYQNLSATCATCSSSAVYSQTLSQLRSYTNSCSSMSASQAALAAQSGANSYSGGYASACQQFTATPQGMGGMPNLAAKGQATLHPCDQNPNSQACLQCSANPNAAGCQRGGNPTVANVDQRAGDAGFGGGEKEKTDFNLPDLGDMMPASAGIGAKNGGGSAAVGKTIPNNSGGGIPGGDGGSPASLGAKGKGSPGSPGYDTDVLQGTTSGSGYSQQSAGNPGYGNDGYGSRGGRGTAGENDPNGRLVGMDLKQFLPGGERDPNRVVAGVSRRSQINPKEENIWRIISNKMNEKCKLGVLWRCGPEFEK
jgi:hypothetical protein